jgi:hypothetical protein
MKKAICALLVLAMATASFALWTPPAAADQPRTLGQKFRHYSPLPATVVLFPLALTAFTADVPIYLLTRQQPLTYGLTQAELVDGYNPITDKNSGNNVDEHAVDVTDSY